MAAAATGRKAVVVTVVVSVVMAALELGEIRRSPPPRKVVTLGAVVSGARSVSVGVAGWVVTGAAAVVELVFGGCGLSAAPCPARRDSP